jgi:hypothetical protein
MAISFFSYRFKLFYTLLFKMTIISFRVRLEEFVALANQQLGF